MLLGSGRFKRTDAYKACARVLDAAGIDHRVTDTTRHIVVVFEYLGQRCEKMLSRGHHRTNTAKMAAADIRRLMRAAEIKNGTPERAPLCRVELVPTPSSAHEERETMDSIIEAPPVVEPRVFVRDGEVLTSSQDVATVFEKQHGHVLRDIEALLEAHAPILEHGMFVYQQQSHPTVVGRKDKFYLLSRDGFTLLAMGYTGRRAIEFKIRYIQRFRAMEKELAGQSLDAPRQDFGELGELIRRTDGIARMLSGKVTGLERVLGDVVASTELLLEERLGTATLAAPRDMLTAGEVIVDLAEVPATRIKGTLASQVSARLQKFCARHGHPLGIVDLRPGEKLTYPRAAAQAWLEQGGRVFIWAAVERRPKSAI